MGEKKEPVENANPYWGGDNIFIHPALDFKNGTAFVAQWLPSNDEKMSRRCYVFTNEKNFLEINNDNLTSFNDIKFSVLPGDLQEKWSIGAIKNYVNGFAPQVSVKEVYERILAEYRYYMDFQNEEDYKLLALWTLGTYFFPTFSTYPYIYLNAVKRSGKTKCLMLASCIAFNAKPVLCLTPATLFRLIHNNRCTLLIDETEKVHRREETDMRSMLLAGYKRGMKVPRAEEKGGKKGHFEVREYDVYSPKMLANISGIEDVLEDRCISLILQRTLNKKIANRQVEIEDKKWQEIRDLSYLCLLHNFKEIEELNRLFWEKMVDSVDFVAPEKRIHILPPTIMEPKKHISHSSIYTIYTIYQNLMANQPKLTSRFLELFQPIFVISAAVDETGELLHNMLDYAAKKVDEKMVNDVVSETDSSIVEALVDLVEKDGWFQTKDIKDILLNREPELEKWLTSQWLGRALGRLGLREKRKVHGRAEWFIRRSDAEKMAERMGVEIKPQENQESTELKPEESKQIDLSNYMEEEDERNTRMD